MVAQSTIGKSHNRHKLLMVVFIDNLSEAAQVVADVSSVRIRIDWLDQAFQRVNE